MAFGGNTRDNINDLPVVNINGGMLSRQYLLAWGESIDLDEYIRNTFYE